MVRKTTSLSSLLLIAAIITIVFFCINLSFGSVVLASAGIYNALIHKTPDQQSLALAKSPTSEEMVLEETISKITPSFTLALQDTEIPVGTNTPDSPPEEPTLTPLVATEAPLPTSTPTLEPTLTFTLTPTPEPIQATPTFDFTAQAQPFANYIDENLFDVASELPPYGLILSTNSGKFYRLDDYNSSWAQTDSYQKTYTGYDFDNFVLRADATWQVAGNASNAVNSGCGIIFHEDEGENHYLVLFTIGDRAILYRRMGGSLTNLGASYRYEVDPDLAQAQIMVAVEDNHIHIFVNGKEIYNKQQIYLESGKMAFTVISGSSLDYGTHCELHNVELWEIVK